MTFRILPAIIGFFLIFSTSLWAKTMFVTDRIEVGLRSGIGIENRIIASLKTGDRVEVLESDNNWAKVRLPNGTVGWIATRFLVDSVKQIPPPDPKTQEELRQLKEANQNLLRQQGLWSQEKDRLLKEVEEGKKTVQELQQEKVKRVAPEVSTLKARNDKLEGELALYKKQLDAFSQQEKERHTSQRIVWFLAGSGVLFVGIILGWLSGRGRRKTSRYY
jgi:SH3 domain protein